MPGVGHGDSERAVPVRRRGRIAPTGDDCFLRPGAGAGDELQLILLVGMGGAFEQLRRQLAERREEPRVPRFRRARGDGGLQLVGVIRADRAHRHVAAVA